MSLRYVWELTLVEVRRSKPVGRLYLLAAGGVVLLFVFEKATDDNILLVPTSVTLGIAGVTPFAVLRDKLDGTLEFLLSLPVTVADVVMARFLTAAASLLPGVIATGVTFGLVVPPADLGPVADVAPLQMALAYWMLLTLASWCMTAASTCELKQLAGLSLVGMIVFVG